MKQCVLLVFVCNIFIVSSWSQVGERYLNLPKKYETPYLGISVDKSGEYSENKPWKVLVDRDDVPVYDNKELTHVIDTVNFLEEYIVWKETDQSVKLVGGPDDNDIINNNFFGQSAEVIGWVKKKDLILWERSLKMDGIAIKILCYKSMKPINFKDGKISREMVLKEKEIDVYNLVKQEGEAFLICKRHLIHKDIPENELFWVNKKQVFFLQDNLTLIPSREKLMDKQTIYIYDSEEGALNMNVADTALTINQINNSWGLFNLQRMENDIVRAKAVINGVVRDVFVNNSGDDFIKALFVDYRQYLIMKELVDVFTRSFTLDELIERINEFSDHYGIKEKREYDHLLEMVSEIIETRMSTMKAYEIQFIKDLSDGEFRLIYDAFKKNYEKFYYDNQLSEYSFYQDQMYYWIPENWVRPDILAGLSMHDIIDSGMEGRRTYSNYDVLYLDNSATSSEKTYEQLQAEISRSNMVLKKILNQNSTDDKEYGHLLYYTNGMSPIVGKGEGTFNDIISETRTSHAIRPVPYHDKQAMEKLILLDDVEGITNRLNIHFMMSDYLFNREMQGRSLLLQEFPERLHSITEATQTFVYLYLYDAKNDKTELEEKLNKYIKNNLNENPKISYTINQYH